MKTKDVQIGQVYAIKVAAHITGVRITEEHPYGGWSGININTNKPIRIRTASRIRGIWKHSGEESPTAAQGATKSAEPKRIPLLQRHATVPNVAGWTPR